MSLDQVHLSTHMSVSPIPILTVVLKIFCVENHTMTVSNIRSLAVLALAHLIFVTFEIWTVSSPKYDLLCKRNSCDCATCVATFFDKFCDSHTSELDTLCDKSRARSSKPTNIRPWARSAPTTTASESVYVVSTATPTWPLLLDDVVCTNMAKFRYIINRRCRASPYASAGRLFVKRSRPISLFKVNPPHR